jgi:hypothetical protein
MCTHSKSLFYYVLPYKVSSHQASYSLSCTYTDGYVERWFIFVVKESCMRLIIAINVKNWCALFQYFLGARAIWWSL